MLEYLALAITSSGNADWEELSSASLSSTVRVVSPILYRFVPWA